MDYENGIRLIQQNKRTLQLLTTVSIVTTIVIFGVTLVDIYDCSQTMKNINK